MIGTFARFDLRNTFGQGTRVLAPLAFVAVIAIVFPLPAFAVVGAVTVGSLIASGPFLADERGRLDTLYATLPVSRRHVVIGRYVTLVVLYLVAAVIASVVSLVAAGVRGTPFDGGAFVLAHAVGFLVVSVALAVQVPFFFSVGFTRARPMMYLPLAALVVVAWLASNSGLLDHVTEISVPAVPLATAEGFAVLLGLALLAGSAAVSVSRYRRRAL
jgi:ABC-type transport system involved in multi-copper enzyme maturation permease subunit